MNMVSEVLIYNSLENCYEPTRVDEVGIKVFLDGSWFREKTTSLEEYLEYYEFLSLEECQLQLFLIKEYEI